MKNYIAIMLVGVAFVVGVTLTNAIAQNTTTTYAPVVDSTSALITSITSIVIAIGGIIGLLVKAGVIDRKIGSAAVMASDAAVAVRDNRQTIKDLSQNTYDIVKQTSPESAKFADENLAPIMNTAATQLSEYANKVDRFTELGSRLSKKGETTTSEIKEDAQLREMIPDEIVKD